MSDPRTRTAALVLAGAGGLFAWWGWKQGAYFGGVFYPGAIAVFLLLALMLAMAPLDARLGGPARVAFAALLGLAVLQLASALWSPVPAAAVEYAWHGFLYVAVFLLGIWATNLLRGRMAAVLAPVAIAGGLVGLGVAAVLASGNDVTWYLHDDATLRFPIGYRNAAAAFFMICLWPLLALVAGNWDWRVRAALVPLGTVLVELAFLSQSRGSLPAVGAACLVFLALSRDRLRAAAAIALVALPAVPALPTLLRVYRHGSADAGAIPLLESSATAIWLTAGLSLLLAAVALGVVAPRLRLSRPSRLALGRGLAALAVLAAIVGGAAFVARHGGPVEFVDQRVDEFTEVGYPDLSGQGIRYGANVGSNRHDFWRVAVDVGADQPLLGAGGGAFQVEYLRLRHSGETPEDPHSVEALMFSELGLLGLALFLAAVGGAAVAGVRSRRLGPAAATLVAGSLGAATQWLVQSSYDWFWNYPGVTAPALFLAGAAAAPALLDPAAPPYRRLRVGGVVGLVVLALLAMPLFLSARYLDRGYDEVRSDPRLAIADFRSAADLNPLDAEPLVAAGTVQAQLGEREESLRSLREARDREPESFPARYLIAVQLVAEDGAAARRELRRARALNPGDRASAELARRLGMAP